MESSTYKKGYLNVDNGHSLYYELFGNPALKPVLFVHGGPGSGFNEGLKKFFDPGKFNVIFYDQRGAGRSLPFLFLHHNTTQYLVDDIEKLLNFLGIDKVIVVGSSWGATLGLLYAIKYPHRVNGLVLTSVFLATKKEIKNFVNGNTAHFFPEIWERFVQIVPENRRSDITSYYLEKMLHGSEEEKDKYFFNWALYDISLSTGEFSMDKLEKPIRGMAYQSLALLTAYYIVHDFFLSENYILQNIASIQNISAHIIQGKSDVVTPPHAALELHRYLPNSSLDLIDGLHAGKEIKEKLVEKTLAFFS